MDNFNQLTPAETERLSMLAEECAEVIQVIGKILRHGYDNYHPADPTTTNRDLLAKEVSEVMAITKEMKRGELKDYQLSDVGCSIWQRKLKYTHHQEREHG